MTEGLASKVESAIDEVNMGCGGGSPHMAPHLLGKPWAWKSIRCSPLGLSISFADALAVESELEGTRAGRCEVAVKERKMTVDSTE